MPVACQPGVRKEATSSQKSVAKKQVRRRSTTPARGGEQNLEAKVSSAEAAQSRAEDAEATLRSEIEAEAQELRAKMVSDIQEKRQQRQQASESAHSREEDCETKGISPPVGQGQAEDSEAKLWSEMEAERQATHKCVQALEKLQAKFKTEQCVERDFEAKPVSAEAVVQEPQAKAKFTSAKTVRSFAQELQFNMVSEMEAEGQRRQRASGSAQIPQQDLQAKLQADPGRAWCREYGLEAKLISAEAAQASAEASWGVAQEVLAKMISDIKAERQQWQRAS
eukprot:gnl/TRDRNA2_/TRDRNA2_80103_c0_seq2.p1 gnl/TRDRNA2_/TRDRNA2_80103_c0~~gnl/TRDRNA2_/TRDRNA2_80103_c0_seq2.p1  ORF type:complete len:281 (-),score=87.76 gnl/TRDRNA2_/TRDRNA2_80103_c0_seq2:16-858(-)